MLVLSCWRTAPAASRCAQCAFSTLSPRANAWLELFKERPGSIQVRAVGRTASSPFVVLGSLALRASCGQGLHPHCTPEVVWVGALGVCQRLPPGCSALRATLCVTVPFREQTHVLVLSMLAGMPLPGDTLSVWKANLCYCLPCVLRVTPFSVSSACEVCRL